MKKAIFNWSGGKDSSLALHYILQGKQFEITHLLSTFNKEVDRLSMHGVRRKLIQKQAESIGLKLSELAFSNDLDMEKYNSFMQSHLNILLTESKAEYSIFGDIFLEDLRKYREEKLAEINLKAHFPLWGKSTSILAQEFIDLGFKAKLVCVNSNVLDESFVGRDFDEKLLSDLPGNVDVCGENGEFHTFVYDGPIFKNPIEFEVGEKVFKPLKKQYATSVCSSEQSEGFWYCDLI